MEYQIHEGIVVLPDDLKDRSMNMFTIGTAIPAPLSLTIARDDMLPDEDIDQYVKRQIKLLKANMSGYTLVGQDNAILSKDHPLEGRQIEAYYKGVQSKTFFQRQAAFEIEPETILVFSITSQEKFTKKQNEIWQELLANFKFRD